MRGRADIAGLLLAAGRGSRFGGDKLDVDFGGKPLGLHAAELLATAVGDGERVAVAVPGLTPVRARLDRLDFRVIENGAPELGMAHSIRLAMATIFSGDARGVLIMLGDMPCVTSQHLTALIQTFATNGQNAIVASEAGTVRSPPVIVPRRYWAHLIVAQGDAGARGLLARAIPVAADARTLSDVDRESDLQMPRNIGSSTID